MNNMARFRELSDTLGWVFMHFLWQGLVLALLLAILLKMLDRSSSQTRYLVACGFLALMVACPGVTAWWLWPSSHNTAAFHPSGASVEVASPLNQTPERETATPPRRAPEQPAASMGSSGSPYAIALSYWYSVRQRLATAAPWLGAFWLAGVFVLSLRLLGGLTYLRWVRMRYAWPAEPTWQAAIERLEHRFGLARRVRLLVCEWLDTPGAIGWIRPTILLPASVFTGLTAGQLEAVLAHEIAHIRRHDTWVNLVQSVLETLFFFHPAVWWVSKRIRLYREYCCDDLAVAVVGRRDTYARALAALAAFPGASPALVVGASGGSLLRRIQRLATPASVREPLSPGFLPFLPLLPLLIAVGIGAIAFAQIESRPSQHALEFPTDRSIGEVHTRKAGVDYSTSNWEKGHKIGWSLPSPAQGTIKVPEGMEVYLNLREKNLALLSGLLPDSLARLECENLGVTDENVVAIASLTGLKTLILSTNRGLTDQGMEKLKPLQNLECLRVSDTGVQKLTFVKNFRKLQKLEIYRTQVGDEGVANLAAAELPDLVCLNIASIPISGEGFATLARIKSVKGLWLAEMEIQDGWLKRIADASTLELLSAKKGNLNNVDLEDLQTMKSLRVLEIPLTKVTDDGMAYVAAMSALEQVSVYGTKITEDCLPTLATSKTLWEVVASKTEIPYATLKEWRVKNNFKRKSFPTPGTPQRSTNPQALKVGIILSDFQATGPHWMPDPYAFEMNGNRGLLIDLLKNANVDLYAVIDPNTEKLGELPLVLAQTGLNAKTVNSTDPAALRKLDVVCIWRGCNILPETLTALQAALKQGLGLVCNANVGNVSPGLNDPVVMDLVGHSQQQYSWWAGGTLPFEVVGAHPILGDLKPGTKIEIKTYNGAYDPSGPPAGTILIGPAAGCSIPFYPMYVRDYGKGHIVRNVFWDLEIPGIPSEIFYMRCVNWAAGRPVDTKY